MIILIPKEKEDEIDWNREIIERFKNFKNLDRVAYALGQSTYPISPIKNLDGVAILEIKRIREVNDFPVEEIDERIAEIEEELEDYPEKGEGKKAMEWIIKAKIKEELQNLRKEFEDILIEEYEFFEGCIFAECYEKRDECIKKLKEKFPNYIIISD